MNLTHQFKINLDWNLATNEINRKRISRNHKISIEGKQSFDVSAAKVYKGDATLPNPEDLLLTSLASCHFMSFLYCCSINRIELLSYQDQAEAFLEVEPNGQGKIYKVILNPTFTISDETKINLALSLHQKANELCFIANSCNFPVIHQPIAVI